MKIAMKNNKRVRSGFAVPGMLLNATLGSALLLGTGSFVLCNAHKLAAMANFPALNSQSQNANGLIANDLRQAGSIESASSDRIVLRSALPGEVGTITYRYDRALGTLSREEGRTTQTVLNNLDDFSFSLFQRSSPDASFESWSS